MFDLVLQLAERIYLDPVAGGQDALQVMPGSHKRLHSPEQISLITQNSLPTDCEVPAAGILLLHPLLLRQQPVAQPQKRRVFLELDFATQPLPEPLQWAGQFRWE